MNAVCMSLSPFFSFQSRFVTYLLTYPRIYETIGLAFLQQGIAYRALQPPQTGIPLSHIHLLHTTHSKILHELQQRT